MTQFDKPGATLERQPKRRAPSSRLADLCDRLARSFSPSSTAARDRTPWEVNTEEHAPVPYDDDATWDDAGTPFPVVRTGYDRASVDEYVSELEREVDEMRAQAPASGNAVSDEIKRIGEQAAAILQTAHQQAAETTRKAEAEAEKCLSDAAANAIAMNEGAKQKLRHLDSETDAVWHERSRLIEDVRKVATALFSLADEASDRFPAEDERRLVAHPPPSRAAEQPTNEVDAAASVPSGDDDVRGLDNGGDRGPLFQP
jgi:cell division septum initiation protein DivIVA